MNNLKFTKTTIEICGKDFKYAKCTNKQVLDHQKEIEAEQDKYKPLINESKELNEEVNKLNVQINNIDRVIDAINRKEDPSDADLDLIIKKSEDQIELIEQKKELMKKGEKLDADHKKEIDELRGYVNEKYGELAAIQLEGMTKEFYVENASSTDANLIRLLAPIRQMAESGIPSKKIEKFVRDNIQADANNIVASNSPDFRRK